MLVHLNGRLIPREQARVDPFDRGFLFGDGLYEGLRAFDGHVVAMDLHVERLREGLREARLPWDADQMDGLTEELLDANKLRDAFIYWQVTRGVPAPGQPLRARVPTGEIRPTVFGYCLPTPALSTYTKPPVKSAITTRDTRWLRGRVKSISLLGNVIASLEGAEAQADDAVLVRDGLVAEGTSSNLIAVVPDGRGGSQIVTPSLDSAPMLAGVTRALILKHRTDLVERALRVDELRRASEVMLLGTLTMVTAITRLDGRPVGDGTAGPVARGLVATLIDAIRGDQRARSSPASSGAPWASSTARG